VFNASDLKKGLKVEIDGQPYVITDFSFMKPGKGQAIYNCKMKNMLTGSTLQKSYRSHEKVDKPNLMDRTMVYTYQDGEDYIFMNENYEQVIIKEDVLGDQRYFLIEDIEADVLFYNDVPVGITLPNFIVKEIVETEPGVRGDTATNVLKPAKIDTGYEVQVPIFVNQGDMIKIDTRTGAYVERA
jgi:elongation factor P